MISAWNNQYTNVSYLGNAVVLTSSLFITDGVSYFEPKSTQVGVSAKPEWQSAGEPSPTSPQQGRAVEGGPNQEWDIWHAFELPFGEA